MNFWGTKLTAWIFRIFTFTCLNDYQMMFSIFKVSMQKGLKFATINGVQVLHMSSRSLFFFVMFSFSLKFERQNVLESKTFFGNVGDL